MSRTTTLGHFVNYIVTTILETDEQINQPTNQPTNRPTNQSTDRTTPLPLQLLVGLDIDRALHVYSRTFIHFATKSVNINCNIQCVNINADLL